MSRSSNNMLLTSLWKWVSNVEWKSNLVTAGEISAQTCYRVGNPALSKQQQCPAFPKSDANQRSAKSIQNAVVKYLTIELYTLAVSYENYVTILQLPSYWQRVLSRWFSHSCTHANKHNHRIIKGVWLPRWRYVMITPNYITSYDSIVTIYNSKER